VAILHTEHKTTVNSNQNKHVVLGISQVPDPAYCPICQVFAIEVQIYHHTASLLRRLISERAEEGKITVDFGPLFL
jgi:hypothetical protein